MTRKELVELRKERTIDKLVNREEAEKFLYEGLMRIRELNCTNKRKDTEERRLGEQAITVFRGRTTRKKANIASDSYASREMGRIRTKLLQKGIVHHAFKSTLDHLLEEYPIAEKEILSLYNKTHIELRDRIKKKVVLDKGLVTLSVENLEKRLRATRKEENKRALKEIISELKKLDSRPVFLETFKRTPDQAASIERDNDERLEGYKTDKKRYTDYKKTYEVMLRCLNSQADWEALAFGLALASGRRSSEIVCDFAGKFERVKKTKECRFTTTIKTTKPKTFVIPLLVDFDLFIGALDRLRAITRISQLVDKVREMDIASDRERAINSSIQQQLSWRAKEIMEGRKIPKKRGGNESPWSFKDSRPIYAQIAYFEYEMECEKKDISPVDDSIFFTKNLGHEAKEVQENYQQFRIKNKRKINPEDLKTLKAEASDNIEQKDRLELLRELFKQERFKESAAYLRYSSFVLDEVAKDPSLKITSTVIKNGLGGNKGIISNFVKIIRDEAKLSKPL